jgi:hypothetical protein
VVPVRSPGVGAVGLPGAVPGTGRCEGHPACGGRPVGASCALGELALRRPARPHFRAMTRNARHIGEFPVQIKPDRGKARTFRAPGGGWGCGPTSSSAARCPRPRRRPAAASACRCSSAAPAWSGRTRAAFAGSSALSAAARRRVGGTGGTGNPCAPTAATATY